MTSRAGNPCLAGSGSPFIATATSASRSSVSACTGVEIVIPSVEWLRIWSAPVRTPARSSRSRVRTPSQRAPPTYGPPTSFETQVRVMSRSTSGIAQEVVEREGVGTVDVAVDRELPPLDGRRAG